MSYETIIPLLLRRGGCAVNKISRSHLISRRRGGRSHANVSKRTAKRDSRATTPSAPFRNGTIFLLARPPLLTRRGIRPPVIYSPLPGCRSRLCARAAFLELACDGPRV